MKHYNFIQGLLIGVCVWGAISVGLRYVHYCLEVPIPHVLLAPGKTLKPVFPNIASSKLEYVSKPKADDSWCTWEDFKEGVGICANVMTVVTPIMSGIFSFLIWLRQRKLTEVRQ